MQLRQQIDGLIAAGDATGATRLLGELWKQEGGNATAAYLTSRYEQLRGTYGLVHHRAAILSSFTLEPVVPLLRAEAFLAGIDLVAHIGKFNAFSQEILDETSDLYSFQPDTVLLAIQTRDIAPELWSGFADMDSEAIRSSVARIIDSVRSLVASFRKHSSAHLIVHTLELPPNRSLGILDDQTDWGQAAAIQQINHAMHAICREHRGVFVLDYGALIARHGYLRWHDERKWLTARMPINAGHLIHLAREWMRFLVPLAGRSAKVLVTDLDNTLWGGVVGEDGIHGIQLGQEYPGSAYQGLQRALLDLHHKGILLAIASKNNPDDAMEILSKHPGMLLKLEHFAAICINWRDKAENLREIADQLNLGIDSLAFLDDNPIERAQIRAAIPQVTVIELPSDPFQYADTLRDSPFFERLNFSQEDRQRTALYAAERERTSAAHSFSSKEDFFLSLDQVAQIAPVSPGTLARIAQLTQKTNQFNLTTRRYSEQQIAEIASRPGWQVLSMSVHDRYGDHGLVGVSITHNHENYCEIDTLLLSCRVIGRNLETAFLSHLAEMARAQGMTSIRGYFVPTKKNSPAEDFYAQHGFALTSDNGDGSLWIRDLDCNPIQCPAWVKLRILSGETK